MNVTCFLLTTEWVFSLVCIYFLGKSVPQFACSYSFLSTGRHSLHLRVYNIFSCKLSDLNFSMIHFYPQQKNWGLKQLCSLYQVMWLEREGQGHDSRFLFDSLISTNDVTLPIYNLHLLDLSGCQSCPIFPFYLCP